MTDISFVIDKSTNTLLIQNRSNKEITLSNINLLLGDNHNISKYINTYSGNSSVPNRPIYSNIDSDNSFGNPDNNGNKVF